MAQPKGIAPQNQTSNVYKKMMDNPIYQQRFRQAQSMEGRDNKAVSNIDKMLGQDIANEQTRLLGMERAGQELSRRSDTLDFARKNLQFQRERAAEKIKHQEQSRTLRQQQLDNRRILHDERPDTFGLELGLGLLATGTNIYGGLRATDKHKAQMKAMNSIARMYWGNVSTDNYGNSEE